MILKLLYEDISFVEELFPPKRRIKRNGRLRVRLIFKDLVDEVVIGESTGLRVKSLVRRRKLFGK